MKRWGISLACLVLNTARAEPLTLHPIFTDHAVVQRDRPLRVTGTGEPGETVTVNFRSQEASAPADAQGHWRVELPALPADALGAELVVSGGTNRVTRRDVLTGDVWICAGQSNMEFPLQRAASWPRDRAEPAQPALRLCNLPHATQGVYNRVLPPDRLARLTPETFYAAPVWRVDEPAANGAFSAVAWHFGRELQRALGVPVGLIHGAVGGCPAEAWVPVEALRAAPATAALAAAPWLENPALDPWCLGRARVQLGTQTAPGDDTGPHHAYQPGFLARAFDHVLGPLGVRGVIWYQGESNALAYPEAADPRWRVRQHEAIFPVLVADWRARLGQPDLPFLTCQLSGIATNKYASAFWPDFRDGQRRLAEAIPGVGLAVTSDLGHPTDVHPREKREVGRRLAALALLEVHGLPGPLPCPEPVLAARLGGEVRVVFRHAGVGLRLTEPPGQPAFTLAGVDGVFHPATAVCQGDAVVLTSPAVPAPARVRHAWQPFPVAHLRNDRDRPCGTFELPVPGP